MTSVLQKKIESLLKKSGLIFMLRLIGMGLSYLAILFISNKYGAETLGRFSLTQTLLQLLILIFSLGLSTATIKLTSDENFFKNGKPLNKYLKKIIILLIISSFICASIIYLGRNWLASNVFNDIHLEQYFSYLSIFIVFAIFHNFLLGFVQAKKKFLKFGIYMYVLPYILFIIFMILADYYNLDQSTTILSYLLSFTLLSLVLVFELPIKKLNPQTSYSYKQILKLSYPMMFSAAFIFISNWTDVFMLGAMVTKTELGIYNAAYKLAILSLIVINAVNTVLGPKISELYSKNKMDEIKLEVQGATKIITYITIPIVLILLIFRVQLLSLFGEEFIKGEMVLIIVSVGLLFNALSGSVGQILNMTEYQSQLKYFTLISVIINIVLNYLLINKYGITGAAFATIISTLFLNSLCIIFIKRKLGFFPFLIK